jgi:hypothetical protein
MITKATLTLIFLLGLGWGTQAQRMLVKEEETIKRMLAFERTADPLLILHNIEGSVSIEAYDGSIVEMEARQMLSAKSERYLQQAKEEVKLISRVEGDVIVIYPETPDTRAQLEGRELNYSINRRDEDYRFRYDFTLRVPRNISLRASTINDGAVQVRNVQGKEMYLNNVNGAINAENVDGLKEVNTVNGAIQISLAEQPEEQVHFKTINGEINVLLPENLKADVRFKSMNGDLFTNYEDVKIAPSIEKDSDGRGQKQTYRLDKSTVMKINGGGPQLDFEVLNGNVYVKKY